MKTHDLKTWPEFFDQIVVGEKTFELRKDDRPFAVGDELLLREYDPATKQYSGREVFRRITHILRHRPDAGCAATFGLREGYAILSIESTFG